MALFCIISRGGKHLSKELSGIWKDAKTITTLNCLVFVYDSSAMKQMCQQSNLLLDQIFKQKREQFEDTADICWKNKKKCQKRGFEESIQRKDEVTWSAPSCKYPVSPGYKFSRSFMLSE